MSALDTKITGRPNHGVGDALARIRDIHADLSARGDIEVGTGTNTDTNPKFRMSSRIKASRELGSTIKCVPFWFGPRDFVTCPWRSPTPLRKKFGLVSGHTSSTGLCSSMPGGKVVQRKTSMTRFIFHSRWISQL
jgi:hypothetical protein